MRRALNVLNDVRDLSELLNGANVEQTTLSPGGGGMQLAAELTRAMPERQAVVRQGWLRRVKTAWTKCELRLTHIQSVTVKRLTDLALGQVPVIGCEAVAGGYEFTIQAPDGLRMVLRLDQLEGSFNDLGSPIESP